METTRPDVVDAPPDEVVDTVRQRVRELLAKPLPTATYRLQLNHTFRFVDATAIVPYLARLGISHVYVSPIFRAAPGSMHGYDVVDYAELNPEIGTREEFDALVETLHRHQLGLIVDFVPNHMGIEGGANAWWQDVLENGEASIHAATFDIDWQPLKPELQGKVLLPILGDQYGSVLERGELVLARDGGSFVVNYWETPLPLDPRSYSTMLRRAEAELAAAFDEDDLDLLEFESVIGAFDALPGGAGLDAETRERRRREVIVARHRLDSVLERNDAIRTAVDRIVTQMNGEAGRPESFDDLDRLIGVQTWRPAFWRVAAQEINYRRFFAINTLAAIRQEQPEVFARTHNLLLDLLAAGSIDGVRIDHPDGLWNPGAYMHDLQRGYLQRLLSVEGRIDAGTDAIELAIDQVLGELASTPARWPLYVVVEKILERGEALPAEWMVAGTVGYEFAQAATALLVDPDSRVTFDRIVTRFTGDRLRFPELVYEMKMRQIRDAFASELNVLVNMLGRLSEHDRHSRDFTNADFREILREVIASFSVYRTYLAEGDETIADRDRRAIEEAIAAARRRSTAVDPSVFTFLGQMLDPGIGGDGDHDAERWQFAMRLQQLTGPVMAKGLEDTAFYRFNRLVALNEVGGDPSRFGIGVDEFHRLNRARLRAWPDGLLVGSTHDTKRSEDVRARIAVLSEVPLEWRAALNRWSRLNRKLKKMAGGALAPHRADEYVIYQTLIGTWPLEPLTASTRATYVVRLQDYAVKVAREASRFTNWMNPDEAYETGLTDFVSGLLDSRRSRLFLGDFGAFVDRLMRAGLTNALAQQLLRLASPGIPDLYQGTELWDDSLVDPDNRRPVDFGARSNLLHALEGIDWQDERTPMRKLAVTARALTVRAEAPDLFARGAYLALTVEGPASAHVVAFARTTADRAAIAIVPRLVQHVDPVDGWAGTTVIVPSGIDASWRERIAGAPIVNEAREGGGSGIPVGPVLSRAGVALLTSW